MEQLNFCFGSTLGTRDILFRLTVGRVCLNLYKADFMGVCNSFITDRSLGYARQIWPPLVLWSIRHLVVLCLQCGHIVQWCTLQMYCAYFTILCIDITMIVCFICPFNEFLMIYQQLQHTHLEPT